MTLMSFLPPFRRLRLAGLAAAVVAALLSCGLPSPASACDCAICKALPESEAERVADFHQRLGEFTKESTRLQLALAREDGEQVSGQALAMVKTWLSLHNAYYNCGPGEAAAADTWQEQMVAINRLVADAFRDGRSGDLAELRRKAARLDTLLRTLDESIGAPVWHVAMLDLRHALELSLAPETAATESATESAAVEAGAWLEARLEEASAFWDGLPDADRPADRERRPVDIGRHVSTLLATPQEQRAEAAQAALAFLDGHLEAFRERIGKSETESSGE